jgi:hypothetical protein
MSSTNALRIVLLPCLVDVGLTGENAHITRRA